MGEHIMPMDGRLKYRNHVKLSHIAFHSQFICNKRLEHFYLDIGKTILRCICKWKGQRLFKKFLKNNNEDRGLDLADVKTY
jgi:hypothetical protein